MISNTFFRTEHTEPITNHDGESAFSPISGEEEEEDEDEPGRHSLLSAHDSGLDDLPHSLSPRRRSRRDSLVTLDQQSPVIITSTPAKLKRNASAVRQRPERSTSLRRSMRNERGKLLVKWTPLKQPITFYLPNSRSLMLTMSGLAFHPFSSVRC